MKKNACFTAVTENMYNQGKDMEAVRRNRRFLDTLETTQRFDLKKETA